ncbi:chromosome segregation protein SMC [Mycolicibacterium aubagnense]
MAAEKPRRLGLFGSVAELVKVRPGHETAIAAVLGAAADALAAESFDAARAAVAALKQGDGGRAAIVLGDWPGETASPRGELPSGAQWALDLVEVPSRLAGAMSAMLARVAVVAESAGGVGAGRGAPGAAGRADGDLVGAGWVSGGSDRKPSALEITSEIEKARAALIDAERQTSEFGAALAGALAEQSARRDAVEHALAALHESDATISIGLTSTWLGWGRRPGPPMPNGSS